MRIKAVKNSGTLFIACAGYPNCKNTMNLPKGLEKAQMQTTNCVSCLKRGQTAKTFKLTMSAQQIKPEMAQVLPYDNHQSGNFCVVPGCDPNFKILLDAT